MAANTLQAQLNALLASMFATGMVGDQFSPAAIGGGAASGFVAEVSTLFIDDADRIIADIAALLDQPVVDFDKVDAHVHQLKGSSSSVGAQKVKLASMHFRQFYEAKSKEGCFMALALVRSEFCDVRSKFQTMMQLEQQIEACSPK
ncbi:hypothetical protein ZWY2020_030235 [Hordeum vulgare]|nr:hypothetical protein ZWY2020_030235 [Hordeum vulgare]